MANFTRGRMAKEWNSIPDGIALMTAASTTLVGSLLFNIPGTILRMLGEYVIAPTINPVATDRAVVTVGIGFVSTDAATVGSTAMPDPDEEAEFPWLYWASHAFVFEDVDGVYNPAETVRRSFDVKTMRRFKPGQSLACVVEYVDVLGAPPLTFLAGTTRVLFGT